MYGIDVYLTSQTQIFIQTKENIRDGNSSFSLLLIHEEKQLLICVIIHFLSSSTKNNEKL